MKRRVIHIFNKVVILAGAVLTLSACDKYLDAVPDNRVELNSLDKASQLLTNGYSIASPAFTDWMTDDVQFTQNTTRFTWMDQLYQWEEVTNAGPDQQDSPDFFWYETYNAIAHANEVLKVLDELPVDSEEEIAQRNAIEAEAKLIRAYGHFMLVNLFAEDYDNSTSNTDLGVPYIKTPETTFYAQYSRARVSTVYDQIEDDLLEGLELISDNFYANSGKYHFTRNAALAFASRFYLYQFDLIRCMEYCDQLLGANPENFIRDMTSDEYLGAKSSITAYPQVYTSPDEPANLLLMRKISLVQRTDFSYAASVDFYRALFAENPLPGTTDERENPALVKGRDITGNTSVFPLRYQSLFERSSLNSNVGTPYHIAISLRGEEVLFNRIECYIYQNQLDEAISDFNTLFARRYSGGDSTTVTMQSLRDFIDPNGSFGMNDQNILFNVLILEKRKEFLAQGMRWFDAKRWGLSMSHDLENGSIITIGEVENDPQWLLQIPNSAVEVGGLEKNER
ncbi:RagB/SusD family nutrient uptake outer membrane protein [Marinoscillum sp. MHG1-6]|uniref:RagB/SusD family nutrient uptake outer membrane protein n=1 Tax=Marinoscillum sp. MHG1-6 TaxID=2959627 RepID=UPI002157E921|nr:RagB/SusD family nutrient uptake outer membrane protein [Marinoscillum sp. MHG1-6]